MPRTNADGSPIETAIAKFPEGLVTRGRYSRHTLIGANRYMLQLMASFEDWVGSSVSSEELLENARLSEEHVQKAAAIELLGGERSEGEVSLRVRVSNLAGHKLPTGYPTRRVWIHLVARGSDGTTVFESGGHDAEGRIVVGDEDQPHHHEISSSEQVQIYEQVLVDAEGHRTLRALDVDAVQKDNRILPNGWSNSHPEIARIRPVGVEGDASFGAGVDETDYRFTASGNGQLTIDVALLYQSVPPSALDEVATYKTAASERFRSMAEAADNAPIVMAEASTQL